MTSSTRLANHPHQSQQELQVILPQVAQVLLAGGDRYLASNINLFRAITIGTEQTSDNRFHAQAMIQKDAAWLNPCNEDNYYLAAAMLSWNNQVESAQYILKAASNCRTFDSYPAFFYAFNAYYFHHDPVTGSKWLKIAADHSADERNRISMQKIAARWLEQGQDRREALRLLLAMAEQARYQRLRSQILLRAERVKQLIALDKACLAFQKKFLKYPSKIEDLVESGFINKIPEDPMKKGYLYRVDQHGKVQLEAPNIK